jgi:hypothetical protein
VRYKKYILNRVSKAFPIRQSHCPIGVPIRIANPHWPVGTPIGQWGSRLVSGSYCRTGWTRLSLGTCPLHLQIVPIFGLFDFPALIWTFRTGVKYSDTGLFSK